MGGRERPRVPSQRHRTPQCRIMPLGRVLTLALCPDAETRHVLRVTSGRVPGVFRGRKPRDVTSTHPLRCPSCHTSTRHGQSLTLSTSPTLWRYLAAKRYSNNTLPTHALR